MTLISTALILASQNVSQSQIVYSDHLQSICLIKDICSNTLPPNFWAYKPAQSLYCWLGTILPHIPYTIFQHVKAHTSASDPASQLNHMVDAAATTAHYRPSLVPLAPIPMFHMDPFSLWSPNKGFIENNLTHFISSCCSDQLSCHLFFDSSQQMPNPDVFSPLSFPYEQSSSGYSTMVQLYVCSGQLPTRALLVSRRMSPSCHCQFRCDTVETPLHLFSVCPVFNHLQVSTLDDIHQILSSVLEVFLISYSLKCWIQSLLYFPHHLHSYGLMALMLGF